MSESMQRKLSTSSCAPSSPVSIPANESRFAIRLSDQEIRSICTSDNSLCTSRTRSLFQSRAIELSPTNDSNEPDKIFVFKNAADLRLQMLSLIFATTRQSMTEQRILPTDEDEHIEEEDELDEIEIEQEFETLSADEEEESTDFVSHDSSEMKEQEPERNDATPTQQPSSEEFSHRGRIVFNLSNLPSFNVTKIICCFSVRHRLTRLCALNKRFHQLVYQPQCFGDVSFFPVVDETENGTARAPEILNLHGNASTNNSASATSVIRTGITYVKVCMSSQHPFVQKIAKYSGMWNFKAELWNGVDWPEDLVIESLQLSVDPNTDVTRLDLCEGLPVTSQHKISNLFFIKFDSEGPQPVILFPKKLQGVGLQSFTGSAFSSTWWRKQVFEDYVFESILFLVLSCCAFTGNELQLLLSRKGCGNRVEHLSLRYVRWEGMIDIPTSLVSLGWFPDRVGNLFHLSSENKLWQLQTRLSENMDSTVEMLNRVFVASPDLRRISFEFIRAEENWHQSRLDCDKLFVWGGDRDTNEERYKEMVVVVDPNQWSHQPKLGGVFKDFESQNKLIHPNLTHFLDCPKWSDDARDFVRMTNRRKLLLR